MDRQFECCFTRHEGGGPLRRLDAYVILSLKEGVESQPVPASKVHTAITNLKRFLIGTFHGVSSPKLQKYLDEFEYRYNRRWWELQLPHRLQSIWANHLPAPGKLLDSESSLS
ncbi:MAG: transposase [Gammaproteobacteria bacterium]|nr:transposase [Gammaproteobacteria bacterium]